MTLEELLAKVEAYSRKTWDLETFVVIETFLKPTWWGGRRRVIVVDVGWERARIALFVRELLAEAIQARPADPPKDTAKLLELLQETLLTSGRSLPETAKATLSSMKLGGPGGRIVKELLGQ